MFGIYFHGDPFQMFRLTSSFALFVLVITCTLATQQASGVGAVIATNTTKKISAPVASPVSVPGADLITPGTKQLSKIATSGGAANQSNTNKALAETTATLKPRVLANKLKTTGPDSMDAVLSAGGANRGIRSGRIVVKFLDQLKVRCISGPGGKTIAATNNTNSETTQAFTTTKTGKKLTEIDIATQLPTSPIASALALIDRFGGTVAPAINKTNSELAALEEKAATRSNNAQPDLAGYIFITVAPTALTAAAEAFNDLDCVEFAQVDYMPIPAQSGCPDRDLSLQNGNGTEGIDIGINCQIVTDSTGASQPCPPPGPIFLLFPTADTVVTSLTGGAGAISCNRPSRWTGYNPTILTDDCLLYTPVPAPATWDCTGNPGCNLGGGINGPCVNPPTGYTSTLSCQYGCRDTACAEYLGTLGFINCDGSDATLVSGWDATCATLANIYCPQLNLATPYNGGTVGGGMPQVDLASQACFSVNYVGSSFNSILAFDDSVAYDSCFSLRGPAVRNFNGVYGILKYTDIGNGDGIRPWGFEWIGAGLAPTFPFAFLRPSVPFIPFGDASFQFPPPYIASECGLMPSSIEQYYFGGDMLDNDPTDALNAGFAQFDNAFKSFPYNYSHDCSTVSSSIPGCYITPCCVYVCVNDPSCCSYAWDASCVSTAISNAALCQSGSVRLTTPPSPPNIPDFNFKPNGAFRARNLALFGTALPNVATTGEYITRMSRLVSDNPGTTVAPGLVVLSEITSQDESTPPLGLNQTYGFINSGYSGGGIDVAGMIEFAGGIGVDPSSVLGDRTVVGVIDNSAIVDHVDLVGQVTVEAGQIVVVPPLGTSAFINSDHGTAVLGVLVASDDGVGITGLLPQAHAIFFPAVTLAQGGRLSTALVSAAETLNDGDVLCVPLEYGAGFTLASNTFTNQLFSVADSLGITTVIPAGNGGFEISVESTSAIIVGAAWPGTQTPVPFGSTLSSSNPNGLIPLTTNPYPGNSYCRWRSSNWSSTIGQGGIDVSGWGAGICTLGVGSLFKDPDAAIRTKSYQVNFGETSGACAMIAGLVGAMNGFAESLFGASIGTPAIRNILNNNATDPQGNTTGGYIGTVTTQCGFPPGSDLPSTLVDTPASVVANGDTTPPGEGTNHNVGGFPKAQECLSFVLANQSFPAGTPFDVQVITGSDQIGNKFSVGTLNNKFLQVQAQQKGRGSRGSGYGPSLPYISGGLATDIQVRSVLQVQSNDLVNDVLLQGYGYVTGSSSTADVGNAIGILYAYNQSNNRWIYLNYGFMTGTVPIQGSPNVSGLLSATGFNPQDFIVIQGGERVVYSRFLTFGFGAVGAYRAFWDQIFVQMNPPIDTGD